ncbi:MAG: ORF6N domain-containing protein [Acetobacter papayae]
MAAYRNSGANSTHTVKQECSAQSGNQITINDCNVNVVEYAGQRVITFKMVDELHGRAEGTARKRFNDNRSRLTEGEDYWEISHPSEIRTLGLQRLDGSTPQKVIILTESGYLMLVKSFTDDLAWQVQKELVRGYFRKAGGHIASSDHLNAQQTGGIVKAGLGKLKRELLAELAPQFAALAEELRTTHWSVGVAVVTHRTAKRWLDHFGVTKRTKGMVQRVSNALMRQSIRMGYPVSYTAEEEKRAFHEVVANAYFSTGPGRHLLPKAVKGQKEMGLETTQHPFAKTPA